jgi:thymidylate kinase
LGETKRWLGEHFAVEQVHAGKPKPTLLSFIPNRLVPTLRLLLPKYRSSHIEALHDHQDGQQKAQSGFPLVFAIRAVLLAYDRRALLIHAHASAANGTIILCDRYPSMTRGAPDGPQLFHLLDEMDKNPLRRWLASTEQRLYQQIPTPDLVISLTVPVEVAVQRNKARGKTEPEDYLRRRHALASHFDYGKAYVVSVSTDQPLGKTVLDIKRAIWNTL